MWPVWRCVLAGIATFEEIDTHWSILDLLDANEVLDFKDEVESRMMKR